MLVLSRVGKKIVIDGNIQVTVVAINHKHVRFDITAPSELPTENEPSARKSEILIADDDPQIRDLLSLCLQKEGYIVWMAESGTRAVEVYREHTEQIAVALLDVQMPGLDGPHTLDELHVLNAELPICFMTGDPGAYELGDLIGRGARHVFRKPFRMAELLGILKTLVQR